MYKSLALSVIIALILGGCCTTPDTLPCPSRPILEEFTEQELADIDPDVQAKIAANQIRLKAYAKRLEARACE